MDNINRDNLSSRGSPPQKSAKWRRGSKQILSVLLHHPHCYLLEYTKAVILLVFLVENVTPSFPTYSVHFPSFISDFHPVTCQQGTAYAMYCRSLLKTEVRSEHKD